MYRNVRNLLLKYIEFTINDDFMHRFITSNKIIISKIDIKYTYNWNISIILNFKLKYNKTWVTKVQSMFSRNFLHFLNSKNNNIEKIDP
jgi:hypothetical protein